MNKIVVAGISFKAAPYVGGASVNTEAAYRDRTANACGGVKDLIDISRMILRRLDIEAAERGQDANFVCSAYRDQLREALRGCDGHGPRKTSAGGAK